MKKSTKVIIIIVCIIAVILGAIKLGLYIFDNSTSIKGIKKGHVSLVDWEGDGYYVVNNWETTFDTPEMIKMVKIAGKEMAKYSKDKYNRLEGMGDILHFKAVYKYALGIKITRMYHLDYKYLKNLKYLKMLYESKEFKEKFLLLNDRKVIKKGKYVAGEMYLNDDNDNKIEIYNSKEVINNLDLDFKERTFEEEIDENKYIKDKCISIAHYKDISIYKSDKYTIKWLKENGYEVPVK